MSGKIDKSNVANIIELTRTQEGMLFHYLEAADGCVYNVQSSLHIEGSLDTVVLKEALKVVQSRHDSLRSVFNWDRTSRPLQIILKECPIELVYTDISREDGAVISDLLEQLTARDREERFDLTQLPLRVAVIRTSAFSYVLNLTHHHILYDGWSTGILVSELFYCYDQLVKGHRPDPGGLPAFSEVRQAIKAKPASQESGQYWKDYLKGYELKALFQHHHTETTMKDTIGRCKVSTSMAEIESFAIRYKVSRAAVIYAACGVLLQRYSGARDITFGTAVSDRDASVKGIDKVMGNFMNIVPFRLKACDDRSLAEVVQAVNIELAARTPYNNTSYPEIKEALGYTPSDNLFEVVIGIENYPLDTERINNTEGINVRLRSIHEHTSIPLAILFFFNDNLDIEFFYRKSLNINGSMEALAGQLMMVIHAMVVNPDEKVQSLCLLSDEDRDRFITRYNDTAVRYTLEGTVLSMFEEQAAGSPEATAISYEGGAMSYDELSRRTDAIAALLVQTAGDLKGEMIGVLLDRDEWLIPSILGILKTGAAYIPIDPTYPAERVISILSGAAPRVLVSRGKYLHLAGGADTLLVDLDRTRHMIIGISSGTFVSLAESSDLAYVLYTSGSTGKPKGVMIEHRSLQNYISWAAGYYLKGQKASFPLYTSISFDLTVTSLFLPLVTGGRVVLYDEKEKDLLIERIIMDNAIDVIKCTPSHLRALRDCGVQMDDRTGRPLKLIVGGEQLPTSLASDIYVRLGGNVEIFNEYGPTETTVGCMIHRFRPEETNASVPIGTPISNTRIYILDGSLVPVPVASPGEIYIAGHGLAKGYVGDDEQTRTRFIDDPMVKGEKMYRTGDLAVRYGDGTVLFLGRGDDQVKIRGFRIELQEIEYHLMQHEQIKDAVVIARQKEEDKSLLAYYISDRQLEISILENFLRGRIPDYMLPDHFVQMERFPLTANGKLDKRALPDPVSRPVEEYLPPSGIIEKKLARIWSEVLKIEEASISAGRSFFSMGGNSLKAILLANKIFKELEVKISLKEFFIHENIASQGRFVRDAKKAKYYSIKKAPEKEYYRSTSAQKRLFFLFELDKGSLAYNMPYAAVLKGEMHRERLERAFRELIRRHESLRTSFLLVDGEVVQKIEPDPAFKLEYYCTIECPEEIIKNFIRPFDLSRAPLIRVGLGDLGEDEYLLMVDMHHIVNDGLSQNVLIRDLIALYGGGSLPDMPLQYKDYAEWQQNGQQQEEISGQKEFWLHELSDEIPALELPWDFPRPAIKTYEGASVDFELDRQETAALKAIGEKEGCTMFMTLLSIYYILLGKLSNQKDIVIASPVAGRQHNDLSHIIGLFINTLPLRAHLKSELSFREFLSDVKARTLACFDNQAYPYEWLIDELKIERNTSRNPLFDALFLFRDFEDIALAIPGVSLTEYKYMHPVAKFDLTLSAGEDDGRLLLNLEYSSSLFGKDTIQRFIGYFREIVSSVIGDAGQKISQIDMLSYAERARLLYTYNDTAGIYPYDTLVSMFQRQVRHTPEKTAIVFEDRALSYRQLNERANQLARRLKEEYGIGRGHRAAIMVGRSETMMVGLLGILKAGAAYVPIDASYPPARTRFILEDCDASLLIAEKMPSEGIVFPGQVLLLEDEYIKDYDKSDPDWPILVDDLCYLIYTSGSTGAPKGVQISHRNVVNFFSAMERRLPASDNDCLLAITSTSFDISVLELFWTLCSGIEVVIHPSDISLSGLDRYLQDSSMDFSLFFFSSYTNHDNDKYDLLLESVRYADKEGFKAVWTPERHFHEFGGLYPNPSVISAALAMITRQIELRSGSIVAPLHDPLRIAEEWSVVDNLSGGRIGLSFASGWNPNDFTLSRASYKDRSALMYQQIEIVRELWKGKTIRRLNGAGQEVELRIFPNPIQTEFPVWITSAGSTETFRSAGAMGANLLTHLLGQDIRMLADNIKVYREARRQAGYDNGKVALMIHTYIGENIEEVESTVEQPFIEYLKSSIGLSKVIFEEAGFGEGDLTDELKDKIMKSSFKRYYKTGSLIGTKSTCSAMVARLKDIDVDEIACLIDFGVEKEKVMEGLKHLNQLKQLFSRKKEAVHRPITMMQSTPSFIKLLREDTASGKFLNSLKILMVGGEEAPLGLIRSIRADSPDLEIYNMYGPTETTIWSCVHKFEPAPERISIGRPILNTQVYILNKDLELLPEGVYGDLYIGGAGVSKGYWKREALTEEKFIKSPFAPSEKIYHTGDIARWLPGGYLEFAGRKDHQVKIRGFRIELAEIEKTLLGYEQVGEAVVVPFEEQDGEKKLAGYFIAEDKVDITGLRKHLMQRLPYYMVPGYLLQMDAFPLTPNGKLDRKRLPVPEIQMAGDQVACRTPEERLLEEIWSKVLGVKNISVNDNFFSIGGDSIKSIQIISRLRNEGYELSVKDIFTAQTIQDLALKLKKLQAVSDQSAVRGKGALTSIQKWFFSGPVVFKHHYNQSVVLDFPQRIKADVIERIFFKLQEHHDALRMVFMRENGKIISFTKGPDMPVSIAEYEKIDSEDLFLSAVNGIQSGIDLENGPLMKLGLFHTKTGSRLLIVIHHLIVDGISWRILFEDIETLYGQIVKNQRLSLPLKTDPFRSWADHLSEYTAGARFKKAMIYWDRVLKGNPAPIPRDNPGEVHLPGQKLMETFILDKEATRHLLSDIHMSFSTQINDILLTALLVAVKKNYPAAAVTIDMESHGREDIGKNVNISRTVGWFTSIFPVVLDRVGNDLAATIKEVKETLRSVPNNGIDYLLYRPSYTASQIFFNYLGQFDTDIAGRSFSISRDMAGDNTAADESPAHDWEILGIVAGGQLTMSLSYRGDQYEKATIAAVMSDYKKSLEEIIGYCCLYGKVELTPSDLTYRGLSIVQLDELQKTYEVEDVCTLSPMQESMLFHHLLDPDSEHYRLQLTYRVKGRLDIAAVENTFAMLSRRYDMFRTMFIHGLYGRPVQVVLKRRGVAFLFRDVRSACLAATREEVILSCRTEDRDKKFRLNVDNLIRLTVLQTGEEEFEFIWSYHHIIMDGWCLGIIVQDFKNIYKAFRRGAAIELPPVVPYARYIEWLGHRDRDASLSYWKNYLNSYPEPATLPGAAPADALSGSRPSGSYGSEEIVIDAAKTKLLNGVCRDHAVTLNTVLQTAWGILLSKYNNTSDVLFGSVVSGRPAGVQGIENMIGLFINTIPVRVQYDKDDSIATLLQKMQIDAVESEPHHYSLLSEIQTLTPLGRQLLDHIFIFENFPVAEGIEGAGVMDSDDEGKMEVSDVKAIDRNSYDLSVIVYPGEQIRISIDYNTIRYDREVIRRCLEHFEVILDRMSEKEDLRVDQLSILTGEEERRVLYEFNATALAYPEVETVISLFEKQAARTPENTALILGDRKITYRELNNRANRIAGQIVAGVTHPGRKIGLLFHPCLEMAASILGVLKSGCCYVPISPKDPADRIKFILSDCEAAMLLTQRQSVQGIASQGFGGEIPLLFVEDEDDWEGNILDPAIAISPEDLIYVIYTSGTTGRPKGVELKHKGVANYIRWRIRNYGFSPADVTLQLMSYSFDGYGANFYPALLTGGALLLMDEQQMLKAGAIANAIIRNRVTCTCITPAHYNIALSELSERMERTALKIVALAGEKTTSELLEKSYRTTPETIVFNEYGPTETSIGGTNCKLLDAASPQAHLPHPGMIVPIGKPNYNVIAYILDRNMRPQPIGIAGELCMGGEGVARGYLNNPALTEEKFVPDPFKGEGRIYRTGDKARWLPDGNIEFLGRVDSQVKIRGFRIEPEEIEKQLNTHPQIKASVVFARGQDNAQYLIAYYVSGVKVDAGRIKDHLAGRLPDHMIPSRYVHLENLPLTDNGKVDRKAIAEYREEEDDGYTAPANASEARMVEIWSEVLEMEKERISVTDNFFDLGGHSLKAVLLVGRISKHFSMEIQLEDIFQKKTVRNLTDYIAAVRQLPLEIKTSSETIEISI